MKAGTETISLVIIIVFLMAAVPLMQAMIRSCDRSKMDYLNDKTIITSTRDEIKPRDYMLSLNTAQMLLMPEVNDNYVPKDGNVMVVKNTSVTRSQLVNIRSNSIARATIDYTSPNYRIRKANRRNVWMFESSGIGPWLQSLSTDLTKDNEYRWIMHVNQATTDVGNGVTRDRFWVISNVIPYGSW